MPEGGETGLGYTLHGVTLSREPVAEGRAGGRLYRVAGLEVKGLGVTGEVYLAEHNKGAETVYRLFRVQPSRGGKRVVESILLERKAFDRP